jgi:hypothetical protein
MGNNLISGDLTLEKIYLHDGFSTTITTVISDPVAGSVVGLTFGLDGNLYSAVYSSGTISKHDEFSTTILDSFTSGGSLLRGITIDQDGNMISCRRALTQTIYLHDGFSSLTTDSFVTPTSEPHGVTWDGTDLYYSDPTAGTGGIGKIHHMDGFSSTVLESFEYGGTNALYDITWDGSNVYTSDANTDDLVKHDGFSDTALSTINSPASTPYGMTWHNPQARLGISAFVPKMIIF